MKNKPRGRWFIYSVIIVFGVLHQDFWAWHDIGLPWSPERVYTGDGSTREFAFDFPTSKATMLRVLVEDEKAGPRMIDIPADGARTTFEFPFQVDHPAQISVARFDEKKGRHTAEKLAPGEAFTVAVNPGGAGGTVTLASAPAAGFAVEIRNLNPVRKIPLRDFDVSEGPWDKGGVVTLKHPPAAGARVSITDDRPLFGFLPVGLAYHVLYSVMAALMWALAIRFAWPTDVEEFAAEEAGA